MLGPSHVLHRFRCCCRCRFSCAVTRHAFWLFTFFSTTGRLHDFYRRWLVVRQKHQKRTHKDEDVLRWAALLTHFHTNILFVSPQRAETNPFRFPGQPKPQLCHWCQYSSTLAWTPVSFGVQLPHALLQIFHSEAPIRIQRSGHRPNAPDHPSTWMGARTERLYDSEQRARTPRGGHMHSSWRAPPWSHSTAPRRYCNLFSQRRPPYCT